MRHTLGIQCRIPRARRHPLLWRRLVSAGNQLLLGASFGVPALLFGVLLSALLPAGLSGSAHPTGLYRTGKKTASQSTSLGILPERRQLLSACDRLSGRLANHPAIS